MFEEIAALGAAVATLLDPLADATRVLDDLLGGERRTLAVPATTAKEVMSDSDLVVTVPYFGSARGGWQERAAREEEASNPAWGEATGDLFLNDTAHLANVPERVWRYELGGYPVIKKWRRSPDPPRATGRGLRPCDRGSFHR